jgi:hypothetical protein
MALIEVLAQIHGDKFHAGIVLWDDVVIEAAPIVHYMKRGKWSRNRVRDYCKGRGWSVDVVWQMERQSGMTDFATGKKENSNGRR